MEWIKQKIKSMIWNIRKQKTTTQNKKSPKNEDSISSLWDNFKRSNIHLIWVPEGEEKEQEIGNLSEKTVKKKKSPNLVKEIKIQVQEALRVPYDGCKEAHSQAKHY